MDTIDFSKLQEMTEEQLNDLFHIIETSDHFTTQNFLAQLIQSPRRPVNLYLLWSEKNPSRTALSHLHFLLSHPSFLFKDDVLDSLGRIQSPSTLDYFWDIMPTSSLAQKKKLLFKMQNFPLIQPDKRILDILFEKDFELVSLALNLILGMEEFPFLQRLYEFFSSPFLSIRQKVCEIFIKFEGRSWIFSQLENFSRIPSVFQMQILELIREEEKEAACALLTPHLLFCEPQILVKILEKSLIFEEFLKEDHKKSLFHYPNEAVRLAFLRSVKSVEKTDLDILESAILTETNFACLQELSLILSKLQAEQFLPLASKMFRIHPKESLVLFKVLIQNQKNPAFSAEIQKLLSSDQEEILMIILKEMNHVGSFIREIEILCSHTNRQISRMAKDLFSRLKENDFKHLLTEAEAKISENALIEARLILEDLLETHPGVLGVRFMYTRLLILENQIQDAIFELKWLLKKFPDHLDSLKLLAKIWVSEKQPAKALPLLRNALLQRPSDPGLMDLMCQCLILQKEFAKAILIYLDIPQGFCEPTLGEALLEHCFLVKDRAGFSKIFAKNQAWFSKVTKIVTQNFLLFHPNLQNEQIESFLSTLKPSDCKIALFILKNSSCDLEQKIFLLEKLMSFAEEKQTAALELANLYLQKDPQKSLEIIKTIEFSPACDLIQIEAWILLAMEDQALSLLERLLLQSPNQPKLLFLTARALFGRKQWARCLSYLDPLEKLHKLSSHAQLLKIQSLMNLGETHNSQKHLFQALEVRPVIRDVWLYFCEVLNELPVQKNTIRLAKEAKEILCDHDESLFFLFQWFCTIDLDFSRQIANQILERKEDPKIFLWLAIQNFQETKYHEACKQFEKASCILEPKHLFLWIESEMMILNYQKAFLLCLEILKSEKETTNLKKVENILKALITKRDSYKEIFTVHPHWAHEDNGKNMSLLLNHFPLLFYKTACTLIKQREYETAIFYLENLRSAAIFMYRSLYLQAVCHLYLLENQKALEIFHNALLHDKKSDKIRFLMAQIEYEEENFSRAKELFVTVFNSSLFVCETLEYLFQIYKNEKRIEVFIHLTSQMDKTLSGFERIEFLRAKAMMEKGDFQQAISCLEKVPQDSPLFTLCAWNLCLCYKHLANLQQALKGMEALRAFSLEIHNYFYETAHTGFLLKQYEKSANLFQIALEKGEEKEKSALLLTQSFLYLDRFDEAMETMKDYDFACDPDLLYLMTQRLFEKNLFVKICDLLSKKLELILSFENTKKFSLLQALILALFHSSHPRFEIITKTICLKYPDMVLKFSSCSLPAKLQEKILEICALSCPDHEKIQIANCLFLHKSEKSDYKKVKAWLEKTIKLLEGKKEYENDLWLCLKALGMMNGERQEIIFYLESALKISQNDLEILEKLSLLYHQNNDEDNRFRIDKILFFQSPSAQVSFRLIHSFLQRNDRQNAIIHCNYYLKSYAGDFEIWKRLAQLCKEEKMYIRQIEALKQIERQFPAKMEKDHYLVCAEAFLCLNQDEKAASCFSKYLASDPLNHGLRFQLASIYRKHNLPKARITLQEILVQEPENLSVRLELAHVLHEEKNPLAALEQISLLLRQSPYHLKAMILQTKLFYETKQLHLAMKSADKILSVEPQNHEIRRLQAEIFHSKGLFEEAREQYNILFHTLNQYEDLLEIALLNLKISKKELALSQLSRIEKSAPTGSRVARMAKTILLKQGVA